VIDLAKLVADTAGGEIAFLPNPRVEAEENELSVRNDHFLALGLRPTLLSGEGRYQRTAWLLGASAPLWERAGRWYTGSPAFESLHQVAERVARARLGDERFRRLRAAGAAALADQAVERALSDADEDGEPA
jgi:hypothetical protein